IFDQTPAIPENCQWAMFLRNHDELTLEMVTDEERDFMYKAYAKDPKARINLGIRHRLAPLMDNNRRKIELMNSLLFSLPGTPVIYYGDEIGMGDNFYLGDRDGVRTPMQWSSDRNAGFSEANPHTLYLPLILDPEYYYEAVNVELQRRNTSSLFWYMKRIISMRKAFKAFSRGDMAFLPVENPKVLAFTRSYEEETILVVVNLSKHSQPAEVDLKAYLGYQPVEVFSKNRFPAIREENPYFFTLGPHAYQWFRLEKTKSTADEKRGMPQLRLQQWDSIGEPRFLREMETTILPAYFAGRPWFGGRSRTVYSITIAQTIKLPTDAHSVLIFLVEVAYESGLPETYQLAVTYVQTSTGSQLLNSCPEAVLAGLDVDGQPGMLVDAYYLKGVQQMLFGKMASGESMSLDGGSLVFECSDVVSQQLEASPVVQSRIFSGTEQSTSITYNNTLFLKLYRKVEPFANPDVELVRFLTEDAHFQNTPAFRGTIQWEDARGTTVLGMMQELVEHHGDAFDFMQERVNNFIERVLARNTDSLQKLVQAKGTLASPAAYEELPADVQELIGGRVSEQMRLLGIRTGELHKALAERAYEKEFVPEEFSLHYQRSLFSAMQSLVREAYQHLEKKQAHFSDDIREASAPLLGKREELLNRLKRIYTGKLDILKIRNHGNLGLRNVLLTGKDLYINDFGGNTLKAFSERRLKRSPLRDIAQMVCDIYFVTYEGFRYSNHIPPTEFASFLPYIESWAFCVSGFFLRSYLETVEGSAFVPDDPQAREMVLEVFLLERALKHLNRDLSGDTGHAVMPMRIITALLNRATAGITA
ncbi:MAG: alpha-amylase, partial [Flaviaesturariibacter sp.]|nr:alpha-amylase [Flaviaesturariibacter sp.]